MPESHNDKTLCLLRYVVDRAGGGVPGNHLIKLLYLIDLEWVRYTGRQVTGLKYALHESGPWDGSFDHLMMELINFQVTERTYSSRAEAGGSEAGVHAGDTLSEPERDLADHILALYREMPDKAMLDEYVSGTPPLRAARKKGEALELSLEAGVYQKDLRRLSKEFSDFDVVEIG
ncbi:hypothetical protein SY88_12765 [Clostridiales bacterium PH28_bin88]|nr:hypothetical protein SY88_12765 [Clostridiales bacterium PH28_bin88]